MEFKKLSIDDLDFVLDYLKKSALWLESKDIDYWKSWLDPKDLYVDWIKSGLNDNQFYQALEDDSVFGIFRLQFSDKLFWGEKLDKAGYIHSFTVDRSLSGKGLGYKILDRIERYLRDRNYDFIRLDCGVDVIPLINYYKNYGFKEVGRVELEGEKLVLLEKLL